MCRRIKGRHANPYFRTSLGPAKGEGKSALRHGQTKIRVSRLDFKRTKDRAAPKAKRLKRRTEGASIKKPMMGDSDSTLRRTPRKHELRPRTGQRKGISALRTMSLTLWESSWKISRMKRAVKSTPFLPPPPTPA